MASLLRDQLQSFRPMVARAYMIWDLVLGQLLPVGFPTRSVFGKTKIKPKFNILQGRDHNHDRQTSCWSVFSFTCAHQQNSAMKWELTLYYHVGCSLCIASRVGRPALVYTFLFFAGGTESNLTALHADIAWEFATWSGDPFDLRFRISGSGTLKFNNVANTNRNVIGRDGHFRGTVTFLCSCNSNKTNSRINVQCIYLFIDRTEVVSYELTNTKTNDFGAENPQERIAHLLVLCLLLVMCSCVPVQWTIWK